MLYNMKLFWRIVHKLETTTRVLERDHQRECVFFQGNYFEQNPLRYEFMVYCAHILKFLDMRKLDIAWFLKIPRALDLSIFHLCPLLFFVLSNRAWHVCHIMSCRVLSCNFMSHLVMSCHIFLFVTLQISELHTHLFRFFHKWNK